MSASKFPYWYLNQETKMEDSLSPTVRDKLVLDRINFLLHPDRKDTEYGMDVFEKEELGRKERMAFTIMKIGASLDPRLSAWLIEFEGDLFEKDFRSLKWRQKIPILNDLFPPERGSPTWMTFDELKLALHDPDLDEKLSLKEEEYQTIQSRNTIYGSSQVKDILGHNKLIALDFRHAPEILKNRKAVLHKGWLITKLSRFIVTIKHRFENTINQSLNSYADRLENQPNPVMKKIAQDVNDLLQSKIEFKRSKIELDSVHLEGSLDENMGILPPCLEDLLLRVNEVGYIGHWERLQLGIFLKKIGMDIKTQLEFWYNKAVDNVNMTFDDFLSKAGYVIRHIYGLEGGKVDYEMPACNTIQAKMYCTFRHLGIEHINNRVVKKLKEASGGKSDEYKKLLARRIIDASIKSLPNIACGLHLELMTGEKRDKINHPMAYLRLAGLRSGKITINPVDEEQQKPKNINGEIADE